MIPTTKGNANNKMASIETSTNLHGCSAKRSIFIADTTRRQRDYVPSLGYYAKGPLLKMPEQVECLDTSKKTLSKKINSLDPTLHPDRVSQQL